MGRTWGKTIVHVQFFIKQATGEEVPVQLRNTDFAVGEGQQITAVWSARDGESGGPWFLFRNHSTRDLRYCYQGNMLLPPAGLRAFIVFVMSLPLFGLPYFYPYHNVRNKVIERHSRELHKQIIGRLIPQLDAAI